MENAIYYRVFGRYALFTDPITKIGGERFTYSIPTYQSLVGITESVYWKPSIKWVIDEVRVMNEIKTESKGIRPICYNGGNDLSFYTYLRDVEYRVKAHFEFNKNRPDLSNDFNENKHFFIAKRCIERGGRRDIFLGTRECSAYVEPCVLKEDSGAYDRSGKIEFGVQFHSFIYPGDNVENEMKAVFWRPVMDNGIIKFIRPEECTIQKNIGKYKPGQFTYGVNFTGTDEEWIKDEYGEV